MAPPPLTSAISVPAIMSPGIISPNSNHGGQNYATPRASYVSQSADPPAVSVRLELKRWKLVLLALATISAVAVSMVFFRRGVTLHTVELAAAEATDKRQEDLLDTYNSYTGNAAAVVTKPIEAFASMALQLALLRFAANAMLQPEVAWRADKLSFVASTVLLYLVLNGFNALNVQLRPQRVITVIQASDLTYAESSTANTTNVSMVTNATYVVPEFTPGNLVVNTVLRTAVASRVFLKPSPNCTWSRDYPDLSEDVPDDGVEYGFPIRTWLGDLLPAAPMPRSLRLSLLNTTTNLTVSSVKDTNVNENPQPGDLPMDSARAAMLVIAGIRQANVFLNWFGYPKLDLPTANLTFNSSNPLALEDARLGGLLPRNATGSETAEREWLLREAPRILQDKFNEKKIYTQDTETPLALSFSHIDLSPAITFDAVTFEAAVNLDKYTSAVALDNTTRYFQWQDKEISCGPKPWSVCAVGKESYGLASSAAYFDIASQVQATAVCVNEDGTETQRTIMMRTGRGGEYGNADCERTSNTSMLVISIAKRIVADSVLDMYPGRVLNISWARNTSTTALQDFADGPVLVNARKVYTITVGRLGWKTENLAETFGAACRVDTPSQCLGLQFPLSNSLQYLVASADALPIATLGLVRYSELQYKYTPLVRLHEPTKASRPFVFLPDAYLPAAGDVVLPHNLVVNKTRTIVGDMCSPMIENRLNNLLVNHIYMEDGLQPAYTSAMFWLFQNGVVRQAVASKGTAAAASTKPLLTFDGNIQVSALVASIPDLNVWLSLAGCIVLAITVVATAAHSGQILASRGSATDTDDESGHGKRIANVSDPRVIAQVMLDDGRFPPMFLNRKVVDASGKLGETTMDSFQISAMTLLNEDMDGRQEVVVKHAKGMDGVV